MTVNVNCEPFCRGAQAVSCFPVSLYNLLRLAATGITSPKDIQRKRRTTLRQLDPLFLLHDQEEAKTGLKKIWSLSILQVSFCIAKYPSLQSTLNRARNKPKSLYSL